MNVEAIEAPVSKLVVVLNRYPAIHTLTSCGGHPDPGPDQCSEQDFYVSFVVETTKAGWQSLGQIAFATTGEPDVSVNARCAGDDPVCLAFDLRGTNGLDPDAVAEALRAELDRSGEPCAASSSMAGKSMSKVPLVKERNLQLYCQ